MKLMIERAELLRTLNHARNIVERRSTIPILGHILLTAADQSLQMRATDLDREARTQAPADIEEPGTMTVPAHMLFDIVRKLSDGAEVKLAFDKAKERLVVSSGRSRFTLPTLAAEDFPDFDVGELSHEFELSAADLRRLIDKTRFAISTEETRYYLNGILLHPSSEKGRVGLRAVATDGHRLALADLPLPEGAEGMPKSILPRDTVHQLHRLLEDGKETVKVGFSKSKARFEIGTVVLTSKLIDGEFPDYMRVIPQGNDKSLKLSTAEFMSAVDRVSTIANERGNPVKLEVSEDSVRFSVSNPEGGSATEEIEADYKAEKLTIGFNSKYVLEIAGEIDSDKIELLLGTPGSPVLFKDSSDEGLLYVLMPMRV